MAAKRKTRKTAKRKHARKTGRPREAVPAKTADAICDWISQGRTLREFCRQDGAPCFQAVYKWMDKDADFRRRIARARETGFDAIAEECVTIAEDGANDWMERNERDNPGWRVNGEHIQRSKLRVETRLKLLAKWDPKRYGDRMAVDANVKATTAVVTVSDEDRAQFRKMLEQPGALETMLDNLAGD